MPGARRRAGVDVQVARSASVAARVGQPEQAGELRVGTHRDQVAAARAPSSSSIVACAAVSGHLRRARRRRSAARVAAVTRADVGDGELVEALGAQDLARSSGRTGSPAALITRTGPPGPSSGGGGGGSAVVNDHDAVGGHPVAVGVLTPGRAAAVHGRRVGRRARQRGLRGSASPCGCWRRSSLSAGTRLAAGAAQLERARRRCVAAPIGSSKRRRYVDVADRCRWRRRRATRVATCGARVSGATMSIEDDVDPVVAAVEGVRRERAARRRTCRRPFGAVGALGQRRAAAALSTCRPRSSRSSNA